MLSPLRMLKAITWKQVIYFAFLLCCVYIFSIILRVSLAEAKYFGRSDLIPLSQNLHKYKDKTLAKQSMHSGAYRFNRSGKKIIVWRQKINGFQHVYGPALMAYETGDKLSDITFCGNEYMEAFFDLIFDKNGISEEDILDRRKDLHHNAFGRKIAKEIRAQHLSPIAAHKALRRRIVEEVESDQIFISHYDSPRVKTLPSETTMGCPYLPPKFSFYR